MISLRRFESWESAIKAFLESLEVGRDELTVRNVRNRLAHFERDLSHLEMRDLNARMYNAWLKQLPDRLASSTVKGTHADAARFLRWLGHPCAADVALLRVSAPEGAIAVYTELQLIDILTWAMQEHQSRVKNRLAVYISIIATSGMRSAECCALRWENWNPADGTFRLLETKTKVARWAKVHPGIIPLLEKWRERVPSPWVIPHLHMPEMKLEMPHPIQAELRRLGQRLGIPGMNSKRFRSTIVKRVIEAGGTYEDAAAIVGHTSIATTVKHYHRIQLGKRAQDAHEKSWNNIRVEMK